MEKFRFAALTRVMRLFLQLVLFCHWFGCGWFYVGSEGGVACDDNTLWWTQEELDAWSRTRLLQHSNATAYCSWLVKNGLGGATNAQIHLRAMYWALTTVTSVGYGDVVPITDLEIGFCSYIVLAGAGIYAHIFSNFVSYVQQLDASPVKVSEEHCRLTVLLCTTMARILILA